MMPDTFSATRKFRLKILACMLRPRWLSKYADVIKPSYFEREDEHDIAEILQEYYKLYKHPPDDPDDLIAMSESEEYRNIINSIFLGLDDWDLEYASDNALKFAREQAAKQAVLESLPEVERGELSKVVERLRKAMSVGEDMLDLGIDLKADIDQWMTEIQVPKIPTGMIHLDIAMEGGLAKGELGVILAPPNRGKTMALVNIGHGAMGPVSRCNVIHFTLEMAASAIAKRYSARSLFRFPSRTGNLTPYGEEFRRYARVMLPGNLRIIRMNGNINTLRSRLNNIVDSGYKPDVIIIDHGDLLDPIRYRNDEYTELGETFKGLRELGSPSEFDCPVWTATQANRASLHKETITMEDLADSFKKAGVADAIIALCQTREEEEDNQCRLFMAKLRDSASRKMVRGKFYKKMQAIITTEFVTEDN